MDERGRPMALAQAVQRDALRHGREAGDVVHAVLGRAPKRLPGMHVRLLERPVGRVRERCHEVQHRQLRRLADISLPPHDAPQVGESPALAGHGIRHLATEARAVAKRRQAAPLEHGLGAREPRLLGRARGVSHQAAQGLEVQLQQRREHGRHSRTLAAQLPGEHERAKGLERRA